MESWEVDFEWLRTRHFVRRTMNQNKLPKLDILLYLIGIQELGSLKDEYTKEEKQDLMTLATCTLLAQDGHYKQIGRDDDGWPLWELIKPLGKLNLMEQEHLLKIKIINYFKDSIKD